MLITGTGIIHGRELETVLADRKGAYAIIRPEPLQILAISDSKEEIDTYWQKLTCVIPADQLARTWYRRRKNNHNHKQGGSNNDKRRSKGKTGTGKRAHAGSA